MFSSQKQRCYESRAVENTDKKSISKPRAHWTGQGHKRKKKIPKKKQTEKTTELLKLGKTHRQENLLQWEIMFDIFIDRGQRHDAQEKHKKKLTPSRRSRTHTKTNQLDRAMFCQAYKHLNAIFSN